jgi:hypothetical protein
VLWCVLENRTESLNWSPWASSSWVRFPRVAESTQNCLCAYVCGVWAYALPASQPYYVFCIVFSHSKQSLGSVHKSKNNYKVWNLRKLIMEINSDQISPKRSCVSQLCITGTKYRKGLFWLIALKVQSMIPGPCVAQCIMVGSAW